MRNPCLRKCFRIGLDSIEAASTVFSSALEAVAAALMLCALAVHFSTNIVDGNRIGPDPYLQDGCTKTSNNTTRMQSQMLTNSLHGSKENSAFNFEIWEYFLETPVLPSLVDSKLETDISSFLGCLPITRLISWAASAIYSTLTVSSMLLALRFVGVRFVLRGLNGF
uniref:Uncharacterized protein n=1 Tax=Cryptomonas curvata TaxID=233186 RepID=A0A7S0MXD7_9CRYP|mmetsp:Transcript_55790/g.116703  ORF Transcript_55790/g.116703 Transcript_55790/m.116703 type:complete len:167 (+) Transcript_55790:175-675(+)